MCSSDLGDVFSNGSPRLARDDSSAGKLDTCSELGEPLPGRRGGFFVGKEIFQAGKNRGFALCVERKLQRAAFQLAVLRFEDSERRIVGVAGGGSGGFFVGGANAKRRVRGQGQDFKAHDGGEIDFRVGRPLRILDAAR